jgi:hypothetical protein
MYAAGHPPLSGFEPESAAERLPLHWRYDYEKPVLAAEADRFVRLRNALVASVVGMRMSLELAAAEDAAWPELARLDCYDCHHDLEPDGWRQRRQTTARAGRTRLALGSETLLLLAASAADEDEGRRQFETALERLRRPFERNVFGDAAQIRAAAPEAIEWCRRTEESLRKLEFDGAKDLSRLAGRFAQLAAREQDYDSARQLAGAARLYVASIELARNRQDPAVGAALDGLAQRLDLDPDGHSSVEEGLADAMRRRAEYQTNDLREPVEAVLKALAD